jgi:hypothetical protein
MARTSVRSGASGAHLHASERGHAAREAEVGDELARAARACAVQPLHAPARGDEAGRAHHD